MLTSRRISALLRQNHTVDCSWSTTSATGIANGETRPTFLLILFGSAAVGEKATAALQPEGSVRLHHFVLETGLANPQPPADGESRMKRHPIGLTAKWTCHLPHLLMDGLLQRLKIGEAQQAAGQQLAEKLMLMNLMDELMTAVDEIATCERPRDSPEGFALFVGQHRPVLGSVPKNRRLKC